jgi:hypothetical protein
LGHWDNPLTCYYPGHKILYSGKSRGCHCEERQRRACALRRYGAQAWQSQQGASLRPEHHAVQGFAPNDDLVGM